MSDFVCQILNASGDKLEIKLPESHPAWMDMLNLLCGAEPFLWIDKSPHNKLFICSPKLKDKVRELCSKHKFDGSFDLSFVEDFFNSQVDNSPLAFLREGNPLRIDNDLIEKAKSLVTKANFIFAYDAISFGDKEVYTGPDDLTICVCRFCGKTFPEVKFKKRNAHAIPEALGNKLIFCNDECPKCNNALSYIDKKLIEYLKYRRSENEIPNKKNKVISVKGHNFFYDGSTKKLKISHLAILEETENKYYLKLEGAEPITHLGIYKALAKIAVDLMPRELVDEFRETIDWIKDGFVPKDLPNVFYVYHSLSVRQPLAKVFVQRKEALNPKLPRCIVALTLIDLTFFFIVPLGKHEPIYKEDYLSYYLGCMIPRIDIHIKEQAIIGWDCIDMSDRVDKFAHVKMWIHKNECEVIDQSEFDNTQKKNPNQVNFPKFDLLLVDILDCQASTMYLSPREDLTHRLRIEQSIAKMTDLSIDLDIERSIWMCFWEIEVQTIDNRETVLKTQCKVTASHKDISKVYSRQFGEISSFFIGYILDVACKDLGAIVADKFREYDFSLLAEYLMESRGFILYPKAGSEQSVMKALH